jgi:hypothetical protein
MRELILFSSIAFNAIAHLQGSNLSFIGGGIHAYLMFEWKTVLALAAPRSRTDLKPRNSTKMDYTNLNHGATGMRERPGRS